MNQTHCAWEDEEMSSYVAVRDALRHRIATSSYGQSLVEKFGNEAVQAEIENEAQTFSEDTLEEIGSSDISCWAINVKEQLERHHKPLSSWVATRPKPPGHQTGVQ